MFNIKRITKYYVIQKQENRIFVSHQPRWFFYFADKEKFYTERKKAYQKLAVLLEQERFWPKAQTVYSRSLTIDFSREFESELGRLLWNDKPGTAMLWFLNFYNWRFTRFLKLIRILRKKRVSLIHVDRRTFVLHEKGGNAVCL